MAKYLVVGQHSWSRRAFDREFHIFDNSNWFYYDEKPEDFPVWLSELDEQKPDKIFFMHWSYFVPKEITDVYECICFHPSHLPYGRGGTPVQNLIKKGFTETKLTAFRMTQELDAGPIYLQTNLSLEGTAGKIYNRIAIMSIDMMRTIIQYNIKPIPQEGEPVYFTRRTPNQSEILGGWSLKEVYDHVRMLDAPGYPPAFLDVGFEYIITFMEPELTKNSIVGRFELKKHERTRNSFNSSWTKL